MSVVYSYTHSHTTYQSGPQYGTQNVLMRVSERDQPRTTIHSRHIHEQSKNHISLIKTGLDVIFPTSACTSMVVVLHCSACLFARLLQTAVTSLPHFINVVNLLYTLHIRGLSRNLFTGKFNLIPFHLLTESIARLNSRREASQGLESVSSFSDSCNFHK